MSKKTDIQKLLIDGNKIDLGNRTLKRFEDVFKFLCTRLPKK